MRSLVNQWSDSWVFNTLNLENYRSDSRSRLCEWYSHAKKYAKEIHGDIFEFGVYKGNGLISMALLLSELGVNKKIYAFDSFSGFPSYHPNDELSMFESRTDIFDDKHIMIAHQCRLLNEFRRDEKINPGNISTSGDFSDCSISDFKRRLSKFEIDNVVIVDGDFKDTVPKFFSSYRGSIFSANLDCDLYDGYRLVLENAYPYLSRGGMINLDEYYSLKFPGARIAVEEFRRLNKINLQMLSKYPGEFERWAIINE